MDPTLQPSIAMLGLGPHVRAAILFVCVGCASEPAGLQHIAAIKRMGGTWQRVPLACHQAVSLPTDAPYLFIVATYDPHATGSLYYQVRATAAGPADVVDSTKVVDAALNCTSSPLPSTKMPTQVQIVGAASAMFAGFEEAATIDGPSTTVPLDSSPSDVIAFEPAAGPFDKFLLQRDVPLSSSGLVLDFATQGQAVEMRSLSFQGQPAGTMDIGLAIEVSTASGDEFQTAGFCDNQRAGIQTTVPLIPTTSLVPGDVERVCANVPLSSPSDPVHLLASVMLDVEKAPAGPLTFVFPMAINGSPSGWSWNYFNKYGYCDNGHDATWLTTQWPGWPDMQPPFDVQDIPGWPSWVTCNGGNPVYQTWCDRQSAAERCLYWSD